MIFVGLVLSLQIWNKSNVHQKCPRKVIVSLVLFGITVAPAGRLFLG